jgi:hypothetical protein
MGQDSSPWDVDLSSFRHGIPVVVPGDLKKLWQSREEIRKAYPGAQGFGRTVWASFHVDMPKDPAVEYRVMMLHLLTLPALDLLSDWQKGGDLDERVFQVIARIPMKWIGEGIHRGWPFDIEEFLARLRS